MPVGRIAGLEDAGLSMKACSTQSCLGQIVHDRGKDYLDIEIPEVCKQAVARLLCLFPLFSASEPKNKN